MSDLIEFNCSGEGLTKLVINDYSVGVINCRTNDIKRLPASLSLLHCLIKLDISDNDISSMDLQNDSIEYLNCKKNNIRQILKLPRMLKRFDCSDNPLVILPVVMPLGLIKFKANKCRLPMLPILPVDIEIIQSKCNYLTVCPQLIQLSSLVYINLANNQIREISELPAGIKVINMENNLLEKFPKMPPGTLEVYISNNHITSVGSINKELLVFKCDNNRLTRLPFIGLDFKIKCLHCENNNIEVLHIMKDILDLRIRGNPKLELLYTYTKIDFIDNGVIFGNIYQSNIQNVNRIREIYYTMVIQKRILKRKQMLSEG